MNPLAARCHRQGVHLRNQMMDALTPGLPTAELMEAAMPASVLLLASMLICTLTPPTAMLSVPVPMVLSADAMGPDTRLADLARAVTCSE